MNFVLLELNLCGLPGAARAGVVSFVVDEEALSKVLQGLRIVSWNRKVS